MSTAAAPPVPPAPATRETDTDLKEAPDLYTTILAPAPDARGASPGGAPVSPATASRADGEPEGGEPDERALVERAKAGDHDAWEQLLRAVYPRLRTYAARRVTPTVADDVVGETMVRAVIGIARYRWRPGGLEPWLFGIARNVIADEHRRLARSQQRERSLAPVFTEPLPHEPGELADEHASVRAHFELLSESDRDLLELRVIACLSVEQTAIVLGKRPGAVRTAQTRALSRLRALVEESP